MTRKWEGKTVVITGASGGLGRAAAVQFAREGAQVVLGARRAADLEETERQCEAAGGRALSCVTDVTSEAQVHALARAALDASGRIDVWINNAGVTAFIPLEMGAFDEHRRVLETNLHGAIFGARAVLPIFRRQKRGVLINVSSLLGKMGQAFVPSYAISKFAIRGLSEVLRVELADERDIHVCTFFPYAIDTQHFETAASRIGLKAHPLPPTQSVETVAAALVSLAERPRRELHVPRVAALAVVLHALFPRTVERLLLHALRTWHFDRDAQPITSGNLFQPASEAGATHGRREPRIGALGFAVWAIGDLARMAAQALRGRSEQPPSDPGPPAPAPADS
jgi:NAD(P)-dependent dehydrogenase (short-subunit alcohol dehydrogenase family)